MGWDGTGRDTAVKMLTGRSGSVWFGSDVLCYVLLSSVMLFGTGRDSIPPSTKATELD